LYINININDLKNSHQPKNAQKADFETSRLFYERFWYFLPTFLLKKHSKQKITYNL